MSLRLLTDCTVEPVMAEEVGAWLKLPSTADYAVIRVLITAARQYAENYMKRATNPAVWELTLDSFPSSHIELPRPPLSTASSNVAITYYDTSAAIQTLATTGYSVNYDLEPGIVICSTSSDWPDTDDRPNAVKITYRSGYEYDVAGDGTTITVPEDIKTWIKMRVGALMDNREAIQQGNRYEMPRSFVDGLLDRHIVPTVP